MSRLTALIQTLARDLFGGCASVIVCLLDKNGPMSGRELQEQSQLPTRVLQNLLIVLYKHNCIHLHFTATGGDRTSLRYALNIDGILATLRRSKYLLFAQDRWGTAGKFILLQFLKLGFTTPETALKGALSDCKLLQADYFSLDNSLKETLYSGEGVNHNEVSVAKMKAVLENMYTSGVLTVCPTMEELCQRAVADVERIKDGGAAPGGIRSARAKSNARKRGEDDGVAKKTKRVAKKRRAGETELLAAATMDVAGALRAENALFGDMTDGVDTPPASTKKQDSSSHSGSSGRRTEVANKVELPQQPFRVNLDAVNLEMAKQIIENFIATRWNNAMIIRLLVRCMLQRARKTPGGIVCDALSFEDICIGVNKLIKENNAKEREMLTEYDSDMLFKALDNMCRHADKSVKQLKSSSNGYQLDWQATRRILQHRLTCQLIATRFGADAARVFALILDRDGMMTSKVRADVGANDYGSNDNSTFLRYSRFWNDSEISEYALVAPSDARAYASMLAAAGYVNKHVADMVGAAPPNVQNRHFWVFGATEEEATATAIESCYQYIANVFERKEVEVEKLQKLALSDLEFEITTREIAEDILEASLAGIDQALLVLRDT